MRGGLRHPPTTAKKRYLKRRRRYNAHSHSVLTHLIGPPQCQSSRKSRKRQTSERNELMTAKMPMPRIHHPQAAAATLAFRILSPSLPSWSPPPYLHHFSPTSKPVKKILFQPWSPLPSLHSLEAIRISKSASPSSFRWTNRKRRTAGVNESINSTRTVEQNSPPADQTPPLLPSSPTFRFFAVVGGRRQRLLMTIEGSMAQYRPSAAESRLCTFALRWRDEKHWTTRT